MFLLNIVWMKETFVDSDRLVLVVVSPYILTLFCRRQDFVPYPLRTTDATWLQQSCLIKSIYSASVFTKRPEVLIQLWCHLSGALSAGIFLRHLPCHVLYADVSKNFHERFLGTSVCSSCLSHILMMCPVACLSSCISS